MKLRLPRRSWSLPLLAKELVEQANRRRTYAQRFLYALALFGFWLLALRQMYQMSGADHLTLLGRGYELFAFVVGAQLAMVYICLPAMLAGSITQEKENNTLQLLLITDLRPWQILVQKLLSRVLPLLALFFLALPLTAMAYLFGGVDVNQVWASVYLLALTAMQVGAVSVLVAVHCRTTVSAVLACYLLGPVIYLMALFANVVVGVMFWGVLLAVMGDAGGTSGGGGDFGQRLLTNAFPFVPMFVPEAQELWVTFAGSIPAWFVTLFMLWMARDALGTGAISDSPMDAASIQTGPGPEASMARGRARIRTLPHDQPIAWQQTTSLAGGWQTVSIALGAALLSAIGMYLAAASGRSTEAPAEVARVLMYLAWPLAVLVLIVTAARTTSTDRSRQTLEVLLTTPLAGSDILRQKLAAVRRWMYAAMALLVALALMRSGWLLAMPPRPSSLPPASPLYLLVRDVLAAVIYLPLFVWFAAFLGLCIHSPAKATLTTIAVTAGWCIGGVGLTEFFIGIVFHRPDHDAYRWLMLISPWGIAVAYRQGFWALLAINFIFWGAIRFGLARWCLRRADELLGRPRLDPPEAAAARAAHAAEVPA